MLQILRILSLIGLWLSGLNLYEFLSVQSGVAGLSICKIGESFDCAAVSRSSWATFLGFPLASWGIAFYLFTFLLGILATKPYLVLRETSAAVFVLISVFASLLSVFLFGVSVFFIQKLCPLCLATYLVNFLLLAVSIKYAKPQTFTECLIEGSRRCLRIPSLLLGFGSRAAASLVDCNLVRLAALSMVVVLFGTTVAQDFIRDKMIVPKIETNEVIATWEKQPVEQIATEKGGSFATDFSLGKPGSPIEIIEFSDFQCFACRRLYSILKPLLEEYKDKIHFVFKNFPLDHACNPIISQKFHEHACYTAVLARCAGEQDKFWQMADYLSGLDIFDRSEDFQTIRNEVDRGISITGLDDIAIKECLSKERELSRVKQDVAEGNRLIIKGTPALWINGKRFNARGDADFRAVFEKILVTKH